MDSNRRSAADKPVYSSARSLTTERGILSSAYAQSCMSAA